MDPGYEKEEKGDIRPNEIGLYGGAGDYRSW
jgi:hypothetical protein